MTKLDEREQWRARIRRALAELQSSDGLVVEKKQGEDRKAESGRD